MNKLHLIILLIGFASAGIFFVYHTSKDSGDVVIKYFQNSAIQLNSEKDLDDLINTAGDKKYVLLGESSHGTSEYYKWRAEISKRLIDEKGFSFIAVEADWPYIYRVNQYVKGYENAHDDPAEILLATNRWPDWMWANEEFLDLVRWLRNHNDALPEESRVGLYGIDMQDLASSIQAASTNMRNVLNEPVPQIQLVFECFEEKGTNIATYAQNYVSTGTSCEQEVNTALKSIKTYQDDVFQIEQNMLAIKHAEMFARESTIGSSLSWNTRTKYMKITANRLLEKYGENSKGIIWAHNTHVGDARATEAAGVGMMNIGQLIREKYGYDDVFILGFSTHTGSVVAGRQWGAPRQILTIPTPPKGSLEYKLGYLRDDQVLIFLKDHPEKLLEPLGHRAKGSVYNPDMEHLGNYVSTVLPQRYNALIFIRETNALDPLEAR